jgi:ABC-type transporter MlaC component
LHFNWIRHFLVAFALLSSPATAVAAEASKAQVASAEMNATESVSRIRQLAVEIERQTAPREVERRKLSELKTLIDTEAIAQFVLGERLALAPAPQRASFVSALADLVAEGLVERLGGAHAEPFELGGARTLDNGDIVVVSHVRFRDGHRGELDWRMHAKGPNQVMADVLVDGVSVAVGARDQAQAELMSNGGSLPALSSSMRNRLRFK